MIDTLSTAYFNFDWNREYDNAGDVLTSFRDEEDPIVVNALRAEIADVLADSLSEAQLRGVWERRGLAGFDPRDNGRTHRQWFEHIRDLLAESRGTAQ